MRYRRVRQHVREFFTRDWLEATVAVFGVIVFALAVFATFVTVYAIVHFGDSGGALGGTNSWLKGLSGSFIALFGVLAAMCYVGAWALVGKRVARSIGASRRARRERSI
jgi:hypothetical protein